MLTKQDLPVDKNQDNDSLVIHNLISMETHSNQILLLSIAVVHSVLAELDFYSTAAVKSI